MNLPDAAARRTGSVERVADTDPRPPSRIYARENRPSTRDTQTVSYPSVDVRT